MEFTGYEKCAAFKRGEFDMLGIQKKLDGFLEVEGANSTVLELTPDSAQTSLLLGNQGPYWVPRIEPGLVTSGPQI